MHFIALNEILIVFQFGAGVFHIGFDVVIQVPGLILIPHHEEQGKLLNLFLHAQCPHPALPADHQRTNQTTVHILRKKEFSRIIISMCEFSKKKKKTVNLKQLTP